LTELLTTGVFGIKVSMPMTPIMCSYIDLVVAKTRKRSLLALMCVQFILLMVTLVHAIFETTGLNTMMVLVSILAHEI